MRRRTVRALWVALAVVLIAAAVAAIVLLRKRAAPEAARLLPDADAYFYIDVETLRTAGAFRRSETVKRVPEYQQFVEDTGFDFERDADETALAVHSAPTGRPARFSWIFVGKIDAERATKYFAKNARLVERYREAQIFNIPVEDRTVRIALLAPDIAAVSNHEDPQTIRGMIDRYKQVARPFGGPSLIREYYKHLPFASVGWTIARISSSKGEISLPGGLQFLFPADVVVVGSVRYIGKVDIRAQAFARSEDDARRVAEQLSTYLALFRGISDSVDLHGPDKDVKAFFESIQVEYEDDRAIISAQAPVEFFEKLATRTPPAEPEPAAPPKKQEGRGRK